MIHKITTREEWLEARKALLVKERDMTHKLDALRAERRQLPWVRIDKDYAFDGPEGRRSLVDLFGDRNQLAIYHFMLAPGSDHVCAGCAFTADHIDAARQHFEHADLAFAAISRAPIEQLEKVKSRMGWTFPWLSSHDSDFNYDFGVYFPADDRANGRAIYNYGTVISNSPDMFGASLFAKNEDGTVFHTYSTYHRGTELLMGAFNWLDLAPKGRNETGGTMNWLQLHDEY
ncbi:DUF899 domain-containing protein [Sphingosinicella rhizophila]|uniref:Thioredoxin family protein n=1 Tax=Sphingosinicella rhizophila TaxID=3050082 RepID=A0ABU3QBG6_9SPHN|nr:thioredoxin family protein [Sphingosinicella sp. GR2756]MDT9600741.1 thioredoxin family protein [Sphingosinicella sp. GR2756]